MEGFVMKRILALCFILVLCLPLTACGQTGKSAENISSQTTAEITQTVDSAEPEEPSFPFEDSEGRTRYRLVINGTEVETENHPFTLPEEPKGGYYPIEDVLNCFGVACLTNDDHSAVATVINGDIIKAFAGVPDMTYGKKKISAADPGTVPVVIDGALYVPSFYLMQLTDNSIVDFSSDGTAATLETDIVVDASASGPAGIDTSVFVEGSSGGGEVKAGANRCPTCHGVGGHNEQFSGQYMVPGSGTWMPVTKYRWVSCEVCGGTGVVN
jgi:hypothetical protein